MDLKLKERDMKFELLRIVAMIMIICWHYVSHGGAVPSTDFLSINYILAWLVKAFCVVAVNCYVLISGYYLIESKFKVKKIVKLWIQVAFYSITVFMILVIFGKSEFNILNVLRSIFPIINNNYWFVTAYFGLYLVFPFLNILIKSITKKQFQYLLTILSVLLVFITTFSPFGNDIIDPQKGYSFIWFVFLYFVAAYIRLYYVENKKKSYYLCIYCICSLLTFLTNIIITSLSTRFDVLTNYIDIPYQYSPLLVIIASIMLFLFFKNLKIKNVKINKIIGIISSTTFGIYLIHDNNCLRYVLWKDIIHANRFYNSNYFILHLIVSVICVFIVCSIISYIVNKLLQLLEKRLPKLEKIDNIINENNEK